MVRLLGSGSRADEMLSIVLEDLIRETENRYRAEQSMHLPFQNTYAKLPETFHESVNPTPVEAAKLISLNHDLCSELGLTPDELSSAEGIEILSGNQIPEGAEPIAMAYSGHQFGQFNPQLGDGRAILLGEIAGKDIHLKGAGRTPFSRRADGRSALGPVLREYLVSEAMHAIGVPTTRALAAVWTGQPVLREEVEPGGIFTRVASSHLRIGTVQYFASRKDLESLRQLVFYANTRHYPEAETALDLLRGVIASQAKLIAHWMSLGFIHGVMNTDNMTLSGETIDYGPCAFIDDFDPMKKFSYIDQGSRYAYGNQPGIAQWNLTRLAEALLPLIDEDQDKAVAQAQEALAEFPPLFESARLRIFSRKLGLADSCEWELVQSLLDLMADQKSDFTLTFRHLGLGKESFLEQFTDPSAAESWWMKWNEKSTDLEVIKKANPIFIPRNHRIEEAIQAGMRQDFEPFHRLHKILKNPFSEQADHSAFERPPQPEEVIQNTFCGT
ncbi:YdiU family protein [Akkermansiaceae bacterium]|nr:YdiU family protein [Akkermansiaceae bacterium]